MMCIALLAQRDLWNCDWTALLASMRAGHLEAQNALKSININLIDVPSAIDTR